MKSMEHIQQAPQKNRIGGSQWKPKSCWFHLEALMMTDDVM